MSNTAFALDPQTTARYEQSEGAEGDDRNAFWISPFEIPQQIFLDCGSGLSEIRSARFVYPGGETGEAQRRLDSRNDPEVEVLAGRHSGKVLELTFAPPISLDGLARIGERLLQKSGVFKMKATTFNYRMIAAILRDWNNAVQPLDQ
jgi:hypothetical protein